MKPKIGFFKLVIVALILLFFYTDVAAQKRKSGKKPHFTNWARGKDFKYITRKSKVLGLEAGPKYLFVGEANLAAYYREGNEEFGYTALEVVEEAEDDARIALAQLLNTYVDAATDNQKGWSGLKRTEVKDRSRSISSKASFSGFLKVASYYQEEKAGEYKNYHAWALFSYEAEKLKDILQQYANALEVPELADDIFAEIQTASEDLDDVNDAEFNFN